MVKFHDAYHRVLLVFPRAPNGICERSTYSLNCRFFKGMDMQVQWAVCAQN